MGKLNFKSIVIRKAPGFPDGLQAQGFTELSPGINLITGPNGAGKSTTATIIQQLVWHDKSQGLNIAGKFDLNDIPWIIHVDSDYYRYQKEGSDATPEGIPAAETRKIYMLALHELVNVEDKNLAKKIQDESIGGYNLEAAKSSLHYSPGINTKRNNEYSNFQTAKTELARITNGQKDLKGREEKLWQLKIEKNKAEFAGRLNDYYEKLADFIRAQQNLSLKTRRLEDFPKAMKLITGEEINRIEELEKSLETEEKIVSEAGISLDESKAIIAGLSIPDEGIDQQTLSVLGQTIDRLSETERNIRTNAINIEKFKQEELIARETIDNIADIEKWKVINLDQVVELDRFFQEAQELISQKISLENEIIRLQDGNFEAGKNIENLRKGILILSDWLKENKGKDGVSPLLAVFLALAGVFSVILIYYFGRNGLWGISFILIVLLSGLIGSKNGKSRKRIWFLQKEFEHAGFQTPAVWDAETVANSLEKLIGDLTRELTTEAEAKRRTIALEVNSTNLAKLRDRMDKIYTVRDQLLERLHAVPDLPEKTGDNLSTLYWFFKNITDWNIAYTNLVGLQAAQDKLCEQRDSELTRCNQIFERLNGVMATDSIRVKAIYDDLLSLENKRLDAAQNIKARSKEIELSKERSQNAIKNLQSIYQKLSVEYGNKDEIRQLMAQLDDFRIAGQELHTAQEYLHEKKINLESNSLYSEYENEIVLTLDQVLSKKTELENIAKKHIGLVQQITEIETLVEQKKDGREIEDALAKRQNAWNDLENLHKRNMEYITGDLLIDKLKKETEQQNQPKVFKRANELFNHITNGRYSLLVTDNNGSVFRAIDSVSEQSLNLDEISTGTRVQLLLSVRLAFIETQENNVRLPLLIDELLANSDETRAGAIIEALYQISKEGRQIFYFTARPDEVVKWDTFIRNKKDIDHKIIYIGEDPRNRDNNKWHQPVYDVSDFVAKIPRPDNLSIGDYRKKLNMPMYDLLTHKSAQLYIGYLTEDVDFLYECLQKGINQWGQLLSFYNNGGTLDGLEVGVMQVMSEKIRILEYYQELYQIGRHRPIDRDVLVQSGYITPTFMETIVSKMEECNGDPEYLIRALYSVPRFREGSINQLKSYLINKGFLPEESQFTDEELELRLLARISNSTINQTNAQHFIKMIIGVSAKN